MVVKTKVRKIGNSSGIILNSTVLEHLDAKVGDSLNLTLNNNTVILKKPVRKGV